MARQKKPTKALDTGQQILSALTQQEIAQLLNVLLEVLPPDLQARSLAQLSEDTQQTIQRILAPIPDDPPQADDSQPTSIAKQAQTWATLWKAWNKIVSEASQEDGKYIVQEAHWEPPYFDATTLMEDLEGIAVQMQPLLRTAFEHEFAPSDGFVSALMEVEVEASSSLEDWVEITDGLLLKHHLTNALLQWEWLSAHQQNWDAYQFAQHIRECELQFEQIELERDAIFDFFAQLSESEQRCILTGLLTDVETDQWQQELNSTYSSWQRLYLHLIERYAPERYLDSLRQTIPQRWENGLLILEALLAEQKYSESLIIVQETLQALLSFKRVEVDWSPEATLLIAAVNFLYSEEQKNASQLLGYYRQVAAGLNQTERSNALAVQQIAIAHWSDWSAMFQAFTNTPLSDSTYQGLFQSWRNYVDRRTKPRIWRLYGVPKSLDTWWVLWLIDSIADPQKGATWFQQTITDWLSQLPGDERQLGENYDVLKLLTKDLIEIQNKGKHQHPWFYEVVIRPNESAMESNSSRQAYLKQYAPPDLLDQVMNYWKTHLKAFVPRPEAAKGSEYGAQARWMAALKELSPSNYETLLTQWREVHRRRSNLWKAMQELGLN
ncbi:hypothetical protein [Leptolyngbya sp. NIES-2104]|uniref:hypothetical protein n=1 Tax=Leptolyngbya sp. NIES-2104 TaxID=1552121 RepID=UPI0006EC7D93|nr:hypothetical protein [Leptolyngbya sp. NIES-2104]GAP99742.1 hypothetical protein NIES2104_63080 [Leptolyngbya sp. NIES-2104]